MHPASLRVFFATEMWERYGFYVVQSLLALYLATYFQWPDTQVYELVGSFTAITYLSPLLGGWIADNLVGQKRAIFIGAIVLSLSYLLLTFALSKTMLMASLAGVALGTGLLKPNISSLLGNEYPIDSPKRDSGYTIFYMGITTGIILGTTLPSYLQRHFGWPTAFASASLGMVFSFFVFYFGVRKHRIEDYHPYDKHNLKYGTAFFMMLVVWLISFGILRYSMFANLAFSIAACLSLVYLLYIAKNEHGKQRQQTLMIGLLCLISIMFWTFYFQMFMSLTLFIARMVQSSLWGILFPAPYFVSIQSAGMLIFGFILSRLPAKQGISQGMRAGNKFVISMVLTTMAYGMVLYTCHHGLQNEQISPFLLIPTYLLLSLAELLLSPVGLSAITTLADRRRVSTMMGVFFVSLGIGGFLSGKLAMLTAISPDTTSLAMMKIRYSDGFEKLFVILFVLTLLSFMIRYAIKRLSRRVY